MNFEYYANQAVRDFFERFDTEEDRSWVKAVIALLKDVFPKLDHYVTGGADKSYIDIRIGQKSKDAFRGNPVFFIGKESKKDGGGACLWIRENSRGILPDNQEWWIKQQNSTELQVKGWLNSIKEKLDNDGLSDVVSGHGYIPKDYAEVENIDVTDMGGGSVRMCL